jgi:peptidoglycan/LPS O-acetylase OafA/YrhL
MGIEVARGVAATLVILYHASRQIDAAFQTPVLKAIFQFGHAGVDLFFVISGFVIYYIHYQDVGRPERLGHYAGRRFSRIMPTYWVALAITVVITAMGHDGMPPPLAIALQAWFLPSGSPMILGVAWTLNFETVFYLFFASLILHRMTGWFLISGWFGFVAVVAVMGWHVPGLPDRFQNAMVLEFGAGMAIAAIATRKILLPARSILTAGIAVFAIAACFEDRGQLNGYADIARLVYGGASVFIVLGLVSASNDGWFARPRLFGVLGGASYSLYIFQFVFIATTWQALLYSGLAARLNPLLQFVILAATTIIGGILASRYIEQPLIRACRSRRLPAKA